MLEMNMSIVDTIKKIYKENKRYEIPVTEETGRLEFLGKFIDAVNANDKVALEVYIHNTVTHDIYSSYKYHVLGGKLVEVYDSKVSCALESDYMMADALSNILMESPYISATITDKMGRIGNEIFFSGNYQ